MKDFINAYMAMFKNYANFNDRTTVGGYWKAFLINFLVSAILGFIPVLSFFSPIYSLVCLVPSLAIFVRRMNDCGRSWTNIFWCFLPIAGVIIMIVRLCKPSIPEAVAGKAVV